jgi:hypothetical protein
VSDREARRRDRVTRALGDPIYFGEVYVRPHDPGWVAALPDFAHEMAAFAIARRRGIVMLPPEFLKTTLISQVIPLWLTYRYAFENKMLRGMLLSEEEGMAARNLSVIAWHIENNEQLRVDFSVDGRPLVVASTDEAVWREDAIIVRREGTSKDPTWQAKGLDSKGIHGRRLDWLMGDDVITPKNAFSPAMRRQALTLWDLQITTRLVREGHAIIAGNFNHERDLLTMLAKRKGYDLYRRPAKSLPGKPAQAVAEITDRGDLLWAENWDQQRLLQEFADKPNTARRTYLLDPRADRGEKLKLDWLQTFEPDEVDLNDCRFVIGLDGAPGGEQEDLDFFNITVAGSHDGMLDVVASISIRGETPEQLALVGAVHDRYDRMGQGVVAIGGPKVAMDRYLSGALVAVRPDLSEKVVKVSTPGSKAERLSHLGPYAKSGWFRIQGELLELLTSDPADQEQELSFAQEWRDFPNGKHDDRLDALDVTIRTWREHGEATDVEFELRAIG